MISVNTFSQTSLVNLIQENLGHLPTACDSITLNISANGLDSVNTADINYSFTGTNLLGVSYDLTVTWGDNTTSTHTGTAVSNNTAIVWSPSLIHNLSYSGTDALSIELVESVSGDTLTKQSFYYSNVCEQIYFTGKIDCDNDGTIDSTQSSYIYPQSLYLYNSTDTIYFITNITDSLFGFPEVPPGTYSIGYVTDYLLDSINPNTITFPISGAIPNITAVLNCPYLSCFGGTVYCDDNNNGIYDSLTESPVQNMPMGSSLTDSNGVYSVSIGNTYPFVYSHYFPLPTSWLSSNGYYSANSYYLIDTSYLDSNCISNPAFNIPINCNLTSADSVCFSGVIFHDLNHNGILDGTENTESNVAISLLVDGISQTIWPDANGNYSYTGVHIGATNVSLSVSQSWLNSFGLTTYGPISVLNFNCDSTNVTNIPLSDPNTNNISFIASNATSNNPVCDTVTLSISPLGIDSTVNEDIDIYFGGTSLLGQQYSLVVNWGDNSSSTHSGTSISANQAIIWTPSLSHYYQTDSVYQITITLTKTVNNHSKNLTINNVNTSLCPGYTLSIINQVDCDGDGNQDGTIYNMSEWPSFPYYYYFHHSSFYLYNATDTIYADTCDSYGQFVHWPNSMPAGTYSLGIVQSAIDSIDLAWVSSLPANPFTIPHIGPVQTITNTFTCVQNQVCLNGYLFCDDNGNGIMDSNETVIPNAPVSVSSSILYSNTTGGNDTTDNLGYYDIPFTIYDTGYFTLDIDQAWLTTNGYIATSNSFNFDFPSFNGSDSILDCNTHFNIPLVCNATASDSICVNGQLFCDIDNDGVLDTNETLIPNAPVTISDANGGFLSATFTDSLGNYSYHNYHPNTDSVEVTVSNWWLTNNGYNAISPIIVTTLDCSVNTDIAIDCNIPLPCDNTWINLFGVGPYYQNWTNTMALTFGNSDYLFPGSVYNISIVVPNGSELDTASFLVNNYTISGDTVSWAQTISGFDTLSINFNTDAGIPDSTLHTYQAFISGPNLDCDSTNNSISYTSVVGASYDPNNKLVNLPEFINPDIQEDLYYTINFQNTGTAPAQDVFIEDQLSQYLDWSTLEVLSKSHNMFYSLDATGKIVFTFPQIWLPDSTTNEPLSKGYVSFKIKESLTVPINQPIENTAHIFFDLNPAIITNTTRNTNIIGLGERDFGQSTHITVFPNPSTGVFNLRSSAQIKTVSVYDLTGKLVYESNESDISVTLDLSQLSKGMYHIKVDTESGASIEKLILE